MRRGRQSWYASLPLTSFGFAHSSDLDWHVETGGGNRSSNSGPVSVLMLTPRPQALQFVRRPCHGRSTRRSE